MSVSPTLTEAQIARAVRAGFFKAGADPERYAALVGDIVTDVAEAMRAFAPDLEPHAKAGTATPTRTGLRKLDEVA